MRLLRPLRTREIALLWGGLSLSAVGDQLYAVTLGWVAVSVFGAAAGYLSALNAAVVLLAALGLGKWADRWPAQAVMIGADLARMTALLGLVAAWLALGRPAAVPLVGAVLVLAVGQALFQPALQLVLPGLVPDRAALPATNALMDTTDRSARLLGPGVIAILAGALPTPHFMSLDAASFLLSAAALIAIRRRRPLAQAGPPRAETMAAAIARGVLATTGHPLLGFVLRTTAASNGAWLTAFYLAVPLLIEREGLRGPGGAGLGAFGIVIAAYGCTNLLSTLVFGGRPVSVRPQRQMFVGGLLTGIGIVPMALVPFLPAEARLPCLALLAALSAIGGPMKDIPVAVLRQTRLPPGDIAAAVRCYIAANSAGALLASLVAPALLHLTGPAPVLALCGTVMAGLGVSGLMRHRSHREPDEGL